MFKDLAITSVDTIRGYKHGTGEHLFTLDELQNASISQTEDKQDIVGKQGRKLNSLKKNKAVTVSATNGLVSGGLFELQTGGKFENKSGVKVNVSEIIDVQKDRYVPLEASATYDSSETYYTEGSSGYVEETVSSDNFATKKSTLYTKETGYFAFTADTAVSLNNASGNEIGSIDVLDSNGNVIKTLSQYASADSANHYFSYDPDSKMITIASGDITYTEDVNGTSNETYYNRVYVNYSKAKSAYVLENMSDNYSGKCLLYIDCTAEDTCHNAYHVQIKVDSADVSGQFTFDMGDNQTVHAFEAEALSSSCGGQSGKFFDYIVFGEE